MNDFTRTQNGIYEYNIGILKQYTPNCFKLVGMRTVRIAGYEERNPKKQGKKNSAGNTSKLRESLSRSRSMVNELAKCNDWEHFVTLTLNGELHDRYNLDSSVRQLSKWLNNLNYRMSLNIKYLLVPEPHKDDAWHFHGLFSGIPPNLLVPFRIGDKIPLHIRKLILDNHEIYNFPLYQEKFGWVTAEAIRDKERTANYITKYITKELVQSKIALNHHVYYASQGLKRATVICRAQLEQEFEPDFKNDYVKIKQYDNADEPLELFHRKE